MLEKHSRLNHFFISVIFFLVAGPIFGQQLTAPLASFSEQTSYPVFTENDPIYYFCSGKGEANGALEVISAGGVVTFVWEKLNEGSLVFEEVAVESGSSSAKAGLADGCYRVRFTEDAVDYVFRAWVFNSWLEVDATLVASNCDFLQLSGDIWGFTTSYLDLSTGQVVVINPENSMAWYEGDTRFALSKSPSIYGPPSVDKTYRFEVVSREGCSVSALVYYSSIVPEAKFSWSHSQDMDPLHGSPQAPLEVTFTNESSNADSYEWFLFKDEDELREAGTTGGEVDSIMEYLYDDSPVYTYENSGRYAVKLVASRESESHTCRDTFYHEEVIVVDTSLVVVAPVFTPNGDGVNDQLIIKTRSLSSLDFQVLNRWGRKVHHFSRSGYIPSDAELAAWDGKVGGKYASAGVYFYVVDAVGRDDNKRRRKKGFVHLIR